MKVVAAFLSNTLFNFVIGLLLAKFLGPADYGLFALAVALAVLIQTVAFDWARLAGARFYSERVRAEQPKLRATLDLTLALAVIGVAVAAAGLLLSGLAAPMSPALAGLSVAVAIANGLFDYRTALVRARFQDGLYVRLITIKNVLSLVLTVGGAFWFGSARAALLGVIVSMAGALLGLRRHLADREARPALADRRLAGILIRYALPVVLANLFYQTIPLVDRLVIARNYGLAESGQFSFAYDVGLRIVAAVGSMLDVLLFQIAVKADEIHGSEEGRQQVGRNLGIVIAILAPACAGLWLVLPSFEALVVPAEFRGPFRQHLGLLMPGLFCYGLIFFALHPLFQINRTTGPLVAVALGASLINLAAIALLPRDLATFAIAQGLAFAAAIIALVVWAAALRPVWPSPRDLIGAAIGTAVMALGAWPIGHLVEPGVALLLLQVGTGTAVYAAIAFAADLCGMRRVAAEIWRRRDGLSA